MPRDGSTSCGSSIPERSAKSSCSTPSYVAVEIPDLAQLGIDPIADGLTLRQLRRLLRSRHRQLKPLLLDQHVIAGIGNIYADEILHAARLRPDRASDELTTAAERRLHGAIHASSATAIDAGGSTLGDAQYVDLFGDGGSYQDAHRVYGRAGERCSHVRGRVDPPYRVGPAFHALTARAASAEVAIRASPPCS